MSRINPIISGLKTLNITHQTPQETLLAVPIALPIVEPAIAQVAYTIASNDLPTLSLNPYQKIWIARVFGAGKVITAATISWRIKKNGVSLATGSTAVAANRYYTINAGFYNVATENLIEIYIWSNQVDSNYDYKAYQIQATRFIFSNKQRILAPCNFTILAVHPVLTLGTPSSLTSYPYPHMDDNELAYITGVKNNNALYQGTIYGIIRSNRGDYSDNNNATVTQDGTARPRYYTNYTPTQIKAREIQRY